VSDDLYGHFLVLGLLARQAIALLREDIRIDRADLDEMGERASVPLAGREEPDGQDEDRDDADGNRRVAALREHRQPRQQAKAHQGMRRT
jgi:hypothetical protein